MAYFLVLLWSIPWSLDLHEFADPVLSIPDNEIGNPTAPLCVTFAKEHTHAGELFSAKRLEWKEMQMKVDSDTLAMRNDFDR